MSAGIITTGSHPRLLLPGITELFGSAYKQYDPVHPKVFNKKSSERNFEEAVQLIGVGMASKLDEGSALEVDSTKQGYARRTQHEVYGKLIKITQQAFDDNLYLSQAQELSRELAKSLFHAKETVSSDIFNNATSTSAPYVGADGKALIASDHPTGVGGTFSNLSSSDLSEIALENAVIAIKKFVGSDGLKMMAKPKSLLIPVDSEFIAHRIFKSNYQVDGNMNSNALKDRNDIPNVMPWVFLSDTDSWFILTDQKGLCFYERTPKKPIYFEEESSLSHFYGIWERYSFDHYDPRAVYGSMGA